MKREHQELLAVLRGTRLMLEHPENDFGWSSWEDATAALQEIDLLIGKIEARQMPRWADMAVLYAPTGPIQEVSVSSGWAEQFLILAARFDAVSSSAEMRP